MILIAGNKGISVNTTGILNIDSVGSASHILHTASTNGDFTIGMDGNVDASLILSSTGTGTDLYKLQLVPEEWILLHLV